MRSDQTVGMEADQKQGATLRDWLGDHPRTESYGPCRSYQWMRPSQFRRLYAGRTASN
jgi:hypothetical protein